MPTVRFLPQDLTVDVDSNVKLLVAANRAKVPIRFGCGSCRCGTCGVAVKVSAGELSAISADEEQMLKRLGFDLSGEVRMACRARVLSGVVEVDLEFQNSYEPPDEY